MRTPEYIRLSLESDIVSLLAHKWTLPVVNVLQNNILRYSAIEKALPSITQRALTLTLRRLERDGFIYRHVHSVIPPQVEYKLTPLGLDLLELSAAILEWVDTHKQEIKRAQRLYDRRNKVNRKIR